MLIDAVKIVENSKKKVFKDLLPMIKLEAAWNMLDIMLDIMLQLFQVVDECALCAVPKASLT